MFSGTSGKPDLSFGMTTADFHVCAKQFDANEELIRLVITGRVAGRLSLSTLADTLSYRGALFDGIFLTIFDNENFSTLLDFVLFFLFLA